VTRDESPSAVRETLSLTLDWSNTRSGIT